MSRSAECVRVDEPPFVPPTGRATRSGVVGADNTRPSLARVYDVLAGGAENYEVDRAVVAQLDKHWAGGAANASRLVRTELGFQERSARFLAMAKPLRIDMLVVCGPATALLESLPAAVGRVNADLAVVLVDNDDLLLSKCRRLHNGESRGRAQNVRVENADPLDPCQVMDVLAKHQTDPPQPVGLIAGSSVFSHFVDDSVGCDDRLARHASVVGQYRDELPDGSVCAFSAFSSPARQELASLAAMAEHAFTSSDLRSGMFPHQNELETALFGKLTGLPTASRAELEVCRRWYPGGPVLDSRDVDQLVMGGLGRKEPGASRGSASL